MNIMNQKDLNNMNFAAIAGQMDQEVFDTNERAYKIINTIVTTHFPGERREAMQMIFKELKSKAVKQLRR